ncbi:unnamed protein product [Prunus armeniaca]|uniref:Uncharacterized protein n=1 Tax=Prunus armeniaca TaxID=36596 RepID=A0A6J5TYE2_PRUAR|nr:unnamed protein product [Prunus armeniaca]
MSDRGIAAAVGQSFSASNSERGLSLGACIDHPKELGNPKCGPFGQRQSGPNISSWNHLL